MYTEQDYIDAWVNPSDYFFDSFKACYQKWLESINCHPTRVSDAVHRELEEFKTAHRSFLSLKSEQSFFVDCKIGNTSQQRKFYIHSLEILKKILSITKTNTAILTKLNIEPKNSQMGIRVAEHPEKGDIVMSANLYIVNRQNIFYPIHDGKWVFYLKKTALASNQIYECSIVAKKNAEKLHNDMQEATAKMKKEYEAIKEQKKKEEKDFIDFFGITPPALVNKPNFLAENACDAQNTRPAPWFSRLIASLRP